MPSKDIEPSPIVNSCPPRKWDTDASKQATPCGMFNGMFRVKGAIDPSHGSGTFVRVSIDIRSHPHSDRFGYRFHSRYRTCFVHRALCPVSLAGLFNYFRAFAATQEDVRPVFFFFAFILFVGPLIFGLTPHSCSREWKPATTRRGGGVFFHGEISSVFARFGVLLIPCNPFSSRCPLSVVRCP